MTLSNAQVHGFPSAAALVHLLDNKVGRSSLGTRGTFFESNVAVGNRDDSVHLGVVLGLADGESCRFAEAALQACNMSPMSMSVEPPR
jgi:hypothetical protein